jgi:hypothetical protein
MKSKALGYKRVEAGKFNEIHEYVKRNRNLPSSFKCSYNTVKKRINRDTIIDENGVPVGHRSPLRDCEDDIIDIIIKLGKIGDLLSCEKVIYLINDLIDNTVHQQRLVDYKLQHKSQQSSDQLKKVGSAYWYAFLQRHGHCINTKKGRKFELD